AMANSQDDVQRALDDARRAREEAERLREDAKRAREDAKRAREDARRMREAAREAERANRHGPKRPRPPHGPPGLPMVPADPNGPRVEQPFTMDGVQRVHLNNTAGKLVVRLCAPEENPGVIAIGNKTPPTVEIKQNGDELHIDIKLSKGWLFRRRQGANCVVRLRAGELET